MLLNFSGLSNLVMNFTNDECITDPDSGGFVFITVKS